MDYSWYNQPFVDGLKAFLDYTDPNPSRKKTDGCLAIRRCLQKKRVRETLYPEMGNFGVNRSYRQ